MIISIEGEEATTKSTFGLSGPLPLVNFSFDLGYDRALYGFMYNELFEGKNIVIEKYTKADPVFHDDVDIVIYELPQPVQMSQEKLAGFAELWDYFTKAFVHYGLDNRTRTLVVDTMTLARRIKCDAYLQELQESGKARKQLQQMEYGHPNDEIRRLYQFAKSSDKNLIAVHHLGDQYLPQLNRDGVIESQATGARILEGLKDTYKFVDVALRVENKAGKVTGKMSKCASNLGMVDTPIVFPVWDKIMERISVGWHGPAYERRLEVASASA